MDVKGEKIVFPSGGTHFHYGTDKYIKSLANMLNFSKDNMNNKGNLRTVLDVGCGVASFGGYLLSSDIIAMSLAPNDVHQNQIQFTLERGIPAYLGFCLFFGQKYFWPLMSAPRRRGQTFGCRRLFVFSQTFH
ncbi:putative S-adenosyl-L-methionine-dependent methyltransferase [Helianthus annuus]|nr:putative S-adenosyl-L-methionine-dependent methyltransferase [Helianthus annuus]